MQRSLLGQWAFKEKVQIRTKRGSGVKYPLTAAYFHIWLALHLFGYYFILCHSFSCPDSPLHSALFFFNTNKHTKKCHFVH